jgi:diguanylate cyclase (GGDEF)-like protein
MIELLHFPLDTDTASVSLGKRLHRLTLDIGFSAARATRLGLAICEIAEQLEKDERRSSIQIGFQPSSEGFDLAIGFHVDLKPGQRELANLVFDRVIALISGESIHGWLMLQQVPDHGFIPNESFLERQRDQITELSHGELLSELNRRNEELRGLLVELRAHAEEDRRREQAAAEHERIKNRELSAAYTELNALREKDRQLANYDILTGLPSRVLFHDRLTQAIAHSRRDGARLALCFLDLDHFKAVNDTGGHAAGDRVLAMAAERMAKGRRSSDTLARIGGDEFTLILPDVSDVESIRLIARSIIESISQPFMVDGHRYEIGVSIGVSFFPNDAIEPEELIRCADETVYAVKESGRNNVLFYAEVGEKAI